LSDPEEGEEEKGGVDETGNKEDDGEDGMVLAEVDAPVPGDDAGEMENIPLERDGGVLRSSGETMASGRVADDPEVDDFERQGEKDGEQADEGTRGRGMRDAHTRRDGYMGAEVVNPGLKSETLRLRSVQALGHPNFWG